MWKVHESKRAQKNIERLPLYIQEKYYLWKTVVIASSPTGLFNNAGYKDHALSGEWEGCRSSRLNQQFRVIYSIEWDGVYVDVHDVNAHDYKKRR